MENLFPEASARAATAALFEPLTFRRNKFPFTLWHLRALASSQHHRSARTAHSPVYLKRRLLFCSRGQDIRIARGECCGNLWTRLQSAIKRTRQWKIDAQTTIISERPLQLPALFTNRLINITLYCGGLSRKDLSSYLEASNGAQSDISQHSTHMVQHAVCCVKRSLRCCLLLVLCARVLKTLGFGV